MNRILIVDDESDFREPCVEYLRMEGYDVQGAKSSQEAFRIIRESKPNILILDLNLKEKYSGLDVLKKALEVVPDAQAAILTGLGESQVAEQSYSAGAKMILEKPMAIEKIKAAIEQLSQGVTH